MSIHRLRRFVVRCIINGVSVFIVGPEDSGKSYLANTIVSSAKVRRILTPLLDCRHRNMYPLYGWGRQKVGYFVDSMDMIPLPGFPVLGVGRRLPNCVRKIDYVLVPSWRMTKVDAENYLESINAAPELYWSAYGLHIFRVKGRPVDRKITPFPVLSIRRKTSA